MLQWLWTADSWRTTFAVGVTVMTVMMVFDVLGYSFTPLSRYPVIRVHGSCYFWLLQQGGGVAVSGMSVTRLSRDPVIRVPGCFGNRVTVNIRQEAPVIP